jgi:magnesium chelatase accessory protein
MATAGYSESWEREKSSWPNHDLSRFVAAAGVRWHVQQTGSGPTMLLVHGTGASTHSWRDLIPILGRHYSVLAMDLPGHGFSDQVSAAGRSIEGMSKNVHALLRELDFKPRYCVGHSAGAVIACRMALDGHIEPRDIVSLNGAFLPLRGAASLMFTPIARLLAGSSLVPQLLARHADNRANVARVLANTGSRLDAAGITLYQRLVRNPNHIAGALGMMGQWDLHAFERDLPRLKTRLVLIVGGNDKTVPPEQALTIARRVASAEVVRLPNLGHLAHEEEPLLVADEIIKYCRGEELHS